MLHFTVLVSVQVYSILQDALGFDSYIGLKMQWKEETALKLPHQWVAKLLQHTESGSFR